MSKVEQLTFFRSYFETGELLDNDAERGRFYGALLRYAFSDREAIPDFSDNKLLSIAWLNIQPNIDKSLNNRRPGNKNAIKNANETRINHDLNANKTPPPPEDMDKDMDKDKDMDMDMDMDMEDSISPEPETSGNPGPRSKPKIIYFDYEGDAKIQGITSEQIALWKENFPAINVDQELGSASAWLDANRKNRKSDVKRFLVNWLNRAQDRAPKVPNQQPPNGNSEGKWEI